MAFRASQACFLECKTLTRDDYKDLTWTTFAEFPGWTTFSVLWFAFFLLPVNFHWKLQSWAVVFLLYVGWYWYLAQCTVAPSEDSLAWTNKMSSFKEICLKKCRNTEKMCTKDIWFTMPEQEFVLKEFLVSVCYCMFSSTPSDQDRLVSTLLFSGTPLLRLLKIKQKWSGKRVVLGQAVIGVEIWRKGEKKEKNLWNRVDCLRSEKKIRNTQETKEKIF